MESNPSLMSTTERPETETTGVVSLHDSPTVVTASPEHRTPAYLPTSLWTKRADVIQIAAAPAAAVAVAAATASNVAARVSTKRWPLFAAVAAIAVACFSLSSSSDGLTELAAAYTPGKVKILLGPAKLRGGLAQLERHNGVGNPAVARLRIVTHTIWTDYRDLESMLTIWKQALARKKPLMMIWDVRSLTFPRVKVQQVKQVKEFVDEFAQQFDTHVQAHVIILSNPIVRAFLSLLLRVFDPPQPAKIVKDDAAADAFMEQCCHKVRSYAKKEYGTGAAHFKRFGLDI